MVFFIVMGPVGNETSHASENSGRCIILISLKIKPYLEALEGIKAYLKAFPEITIEPFFLEDVETSWQKDPPFSKGVDRHQSIIAVGPEAALFLHVNFPDHAIRKIFTMISNPSTIIPQHESSFCGIFLSVNARTQVTLIAKALPDVRTLGILYNPHNNQDYVSLAQKTGTAAGIKIKPLMVGARDEVPELLRNNWKNLDGLLLIPDATVISASLVKHIIKDGLSNNVPVIGYNRFFIQNGALMAFVYDYEQIGRETAVMVRQLFLEKTGCRTMPAAFSIVANQRIAKQLDRVVITETGNGVVEKNE